MPRTPSRKVPRRAPLMLAASLAFAGWLQPNAAGAYSSFSVSWSPSNPTTSTPVTLTITVTGCGIGNIVTPSLYDYVSGPNGYSHNAYLPSTLLSNGGDTASVSVSLGLLAAGSYSAYGYGRGIPCFPSSYYFSNTATVGVTVTSAPSAPGAPSNVSASANDDGTVGVSWTAPSNNGATITSYTVTPNPACEECTGLTVEGDPADTTTTIDGLTLGTPYTFTITATNSAGTSSASSQTSAVTPAAIPGAPTDVAANGNDDGTIGVSWTAPSNNGATITSYTVTPNPACEECTGLTVEGTPADTTTTIDGLTLGTPYTFTITATNSSGTSSASSQTSAVTPAIVEPEAGPEAEQEEEPASDDQQADPNDDGDGDDNGDGDQNEVSEDAGDAGNDDDAGKTAGGSSGSASSGRARTTVDEAADTTSADTASSTGDTNASAYTTRIWSASLPIMPVDDPSKRARGGAPTAATATAVAVITLLTLGGAFGSPASGGGFWNLLARARRH